MTYSRAEFIRLTQHAGQMSAFGEIEWAEINGAWRGTLPVGATGFDASDLLYQIKVPHGRPSEPTAILIVRDSHMARVDVNGWHGGSRFTHVQRASVPGGPETTEPVPDGFIEVPLSDTVGEGLYRRVFQDAAHMLLVDVSAAIWIDPPEMR